MALPTLRIIGFIIGIFLITLAVSMVIPMLTLLIFEHPEDLDAFLWSSLITLVAGLALVIPGRPQNAQLRPRDMYMLTVSSWVPPTHGLTVAQKEWCDALTAKTANRVRCNILPRAVTPAPGTFDAVKNGLVDVSFTVHGYTPGRFVLTQMAEFPFLGDRAEPLSVAFNRIASKHPEFAEGWNARATAYFMVGEVGPSINDIARTLSLNPRHFGAFGDDLPQPVADLLAELRSVSL